LPFRSIGSLWGKWDLHFHTPSSYDYENKVITNEEIVTGLTSASIVAVAITDHHVIDHKRIRALQSLGGGGLTVFPAIELRSELGGSESVHLIGIFSELADPEHLWTKLQGPLELTPAEVAKKGGDDRVYVRFEQAAALIHELGGRVSVHVGRKSNSIENIGNDHPYKQAFKDDLARQHIDLFEMGRASDGKAYREKVFPAIGYERPLLICSDNHNMRNYKLKAPCWIKGDPAFATFQQIVSDPQERVYVGDVPPAVSRVRSNPTKYLRSISFNKVSGSGLSEDWFHGTVPLNSGFVAVIGNKGTGKTALAESIGLLGNTAQSNAFSFLNALKFRQPRNNKAKHFVAVLEWEDGRSVSKLLAEEVETDAVELVVYIPQNYLETVCNEIQTSENRFDKELKSVIFSHVENANRLGAETLDELLTYLTDQTDSRIKHLRGELSAINTKIVELQGQSSKETRQLLLNLHDEKKHELEAHDKGKPEEVKKPDTDAVKQKELEAIALQIEEKQGRKAELSSELRRTETANREALLKRAVADRVLGRIRNFVTQYETFLTDSLTDCEQLSLNPRELVKIETETAELTQIRSDAQTAVDEAAAAKVKAEAEVSDLRKSVENLTVKLDAPNIEYQKYLQMLEDWTQRRAEIVGDDAETGSIKYIEKQISGLSKIPKLLKKAVAEREFKAREIYRELQQLAGIYRSLYSPVQKFIEEHDLAVGNFSFEFEASITCSDFSEQLFRNVSQGRRGSFSGTEEGRKILKNLMDTADFNSEDGALAFANAVLDHLTHDRRDSAAPQIPLSDQLRKGSREQDVLDDVFSLSYLKPRYSITWFGKNIEELSPGERGSLLLIFYLLIDRRDIPLIVDQPEENVDNQTVFRLLVPCIKEARKRRQVIIVTHNPNLAVVCDADQVIHCSIEKSVRNKVSYTAGSLENPAINKLTIDVLEGTRPAFDHRDSKYQPKG
jgi:hypothetical protein